MTGLRRTLGLCIALAAFQAPTWANRPDELQDTFQHAVDMFQRGHKDDALKTLQKVLAMSPDQAAAYELWKGTEYVVWRDLLVEGGEFELAARRLIDLAAAQRKALRNDKDAILAAVKEATTGDDIVVRRRAIRTLSADHGEYAVPYLVPFLADGGDDDRRVLSMHALSQMSSDVVVPLVESLHSSNPVMRRNIALVLGNIGDARAAGALQWTAANDADEIVRKTAAEAVAKLRANPSALANFLEAGQAYYERRDTALRFGESGDVVWNWKEDRLVGAPIPRELYSSEMSKRAYFMALTADPKSTEALAGMARAYVEMQAKIDAMTAAGQDVGEWKNTVGEALTAVNTAGVDALDLALQWSVKHVDSSTGSALCRVLAPLAKGPTTGLGQGLRSTDGAIRSESAVALGAIATRTRTNADAATVVALGEASAREALRVAVVVGSDAAKVEATAVAIEGQKTFVNRSTSGLRALAMLRRAPHVDLVVVADSLSDVTTAQVVDEIRGDARLANVPIVVITADAATVSANFGDKIAGTMTGAEDMAAVQAALSKELTGDRAKAEDLASRASTSLANLAASTPTDLAAAQAGLVAASTRGDKIALPALRALGASGGVAESAALVTVLADEARSEEARVAAGQALSNLLGRHADALDAAALAKVQGVVASSAPMSVREAAAQAIGSVPMNPDARAELLRKLRS